MKILIKNILSSQTGLGINISNISQQMASPPKKRRVAFVLVHCYCDCRMQEIYTKNIFSTTSENLSCIKEIDATILFSR